MKGQLTTWLKGEQDNLDKIIATASVAFYNASKENSNFKYDLKQSHIESYNLVRGKDLCYDRPNTAFAYSLWYHPRRINTFLSFFLNKVIEHQGEHLEIFDLFKMISYQDASWPKRVWFALLLMRRMEKCGALGPVRQRDSRAGAQPRRRLP